MKKNKLILLFSFFGLIWIIALCIFVKYDSQPVSDNDDIYTFQRFLSEMKLTYNEEKVGADIWLKQAIHGVDGINYRYIIKTDCPKWDFETRYMTTTPIEWIDETSAVEVIIYDTQVRYNGTVYASGQYYTIPLLGGLSSEIMSFEEWQNKLASQAYQTYMADTNTNTKIIYKIGPLLILVILFAILIVAILLCKKEKTKNIKNNDEDEETI